MTMYALLPEMIRGSLRPLKEALKMNGHIRDQMVLPDLAGVCESLALAVEQMPAITKRHLADSVEAREGVDEFRNCLAITDEVLLACSEIRHWVAQNTRVGQPQQ